MVVLNSVRSASSVTRPATRFPTYTWRPAARRHQGFRSCPPSLPVRASKPRDRPRPPHPASRNLSARLPDARMLASMPRKCAHRSKVSPSQPWHAWRAHCQPMPLRFGLLPARAADCGRSSGPAGRAGRLGPARGRAPRAASCSRRRRRTRPAAAAPSAAPAAAAPASRARLRPQACTSAPGGLAGAMG